MKSYTAKIQALLDQHEHDCTVDLRIDLANERAFALSAQTHSAELEIELKTAQADVKRLRDLVWTMVEYMNLKDELKEFEQRMLNRLKESL